MSIGMHDRQIAAAEPPLVVERLGVHRRIHVALEELRSGDPDLALLATVAFAAVGPADGHLCAEHGVALGVGELVVAVVR